jgi:imidazolonepropionase-like amidohydrolase
MATVNPARCVLLTLLAVIAVFALVPCHTGHRAAEAGSGKIVVWNGTLIDGTGADPVADGAVVVEDGVITAVGQFDELSLPPDADWVDAHGGTILPGVIDAHTHITSDLANGIDVLSPWLQTGVTTLQDLGTVWNLVPYFRGQVEVVATQPPRVQWAGPIITAPGGYPYNYFPEIAYAVTTVDEARAIVDELIDNQGVDIIKIAVETGYDTDYYEPGLPVLSPELIAAITEEAHAKGVMVAAHVTGPDELQVAADNGVDVAGHAPIMPALDSELQDAIDHNVIMDTTAGAWGAGGVRSLQAAANAFRYWQLGGRIAIGTDYPFQPSSMPVQEFGLLSNAGTPDLDIIVAATKNSAAAIGRGADLGTLEVGKLADIIVVGGDPLMNIQLMGDVDTVILDGEIAKGHTSPMPTPTPRPAVGGIAEPPPGVVDAESGAPAEESDWPGGTYVLLAGAAVAIVFGGWYARKRLLH